MKIVCALVVLSLAVAALAAPTCTSITGPKLYAGGTFRMRNHPTAEWTRPGFGHGLRLDGLFDGNPHQRVIFDFNHASSNVWFQYTPITASQSTISISGMVYGGLLSGDISACNAVAFGRAPVAACTFVNGQMYKINFNLFHVKQKSGYSLTSGFFADDGGYVQEISSGEVYQLSATTMASIAFFVNVGGYRNYNPTYSGYGWLNVNNQPIKDASVLHYRDWGFILCDEVPGTDFTTGNSTAACEALSRSDRTNNILTTGPITADKFANGGTFQLNNHPGAEWTRKGFGYGLRLDGMYTGDQNDRVVFDFNRPDMGAFMRIHFDKMTGSAHIFGTAYGGKLTGGIVECNDVAANNRPTDACTFVNGALYQIDFKYQYLLKQDQQSYTSWMLQQDGGTLTNLDNPSEKPFKLGSMAGADANAAFYINAPTVVDGQAQGYRGMSFDGYSGYGWVTINDDMTMLQEGSYRDWGFALGECACTGLHSLVPNGGTYRIRNPVDKAYGLAFGVGADVYRFDLRRQDRGASASLSYDRANKVLTVFGSVWGGKVDSADECPLSGCNFVEDPTNGGMLFNFNFRMSGVTEVVDSSQQVVQLHYAPSGVILGDGGSVSRTGVTLPITPTMGFEVVTGFNGLTVAYTGMGAVQSNGYTYPGFNFVVDKTPCPVTCSIDCDGLNRQACGLANVCGACSPGFSQTDATPNSRCVATCASAPNCGNLHRDACTGAQGPNSCGACQTGFIGAAGFGNSQCTAINQAAPALAINVGGPAFTDSNGVQWSVDDDVSPSSFAVGGVAVSGSGTITGADASMQQLYQTSRYYPGATTYKSNIVFHLTDAAFDGKTVAVRLHFANVYAGTSAVKSRVYDIYLNERLVAGSFDVIAAAGDHAAYYKDFILAIPSGQNWVDVAFRAQVESPQLSGIQVFVQ